MTSATLYREGPDLDELLAELDAEHGAVRVVEVTYGRDGGVLGFFARRLVGVHYVVDEDGWTGEAPVDTVELSVPSAPPFAGSRRCAAPDPAASGEMLARQAAEMVASGRVPTSVSAEADNVEFARMLLELAAQKRAAEQEAARQREAELQREVELARAALLARVRTRPVGAHRAGDPEPSTEPSTEPSAERHQPEPEPVRAPVPVTTAVPAPVRTPFTLRRQLVEIGVPVDRIPAGEANAYRVVEQLVRRLPVPAEAEPAPGEVIAVVGPATLALAEAGRLCTRLRLDPADLRTAGCTAPNGTDPITQPRHARTLSRRHRDEGESALVVVVATDSTAGEDPGGRGDQEWAARMIAALAPERTLAVLDAASRPADARRLLAHLGPVSALALVGAARTTSPAALWELDVPIGCLDGRPATRGAWVALLVDRLAELDDCEP